MANLISAVRVILTFYILAMLNYETTASFYWLAVWMTLAIILLDALDGWVARILKENSKIGSIVDILADRIVENAYWIVFCAYGWVGIWAPLIVMTRSLVTDTIRGIAFADGCTAFGEDSIVKSPIGKFLTSSRFSRAVYGGAKIVAFMTVIACHTPEFMPPQFLITTMNISVYLTIIFCVLRALPVVSAGSKYFIPTKQK